MHQWAKFKSKAAMIANATVELLDLPGWKAEVAECLYKQISKKLTAVIYKFLTGLDPLAN